MEFGVAKIAGKTAITLDEDLARRITGALYYLITRQAARQTGG